MKQETQKVGSIYAAVNLINGKRYIGQTIRNPKRRYGQHLSQAKWGSCQSLHVAIRHYGKHNFELHVLQENIPILELTDFEDFYIAKFDSIKNGYNVNFGKKTVTEATIARLKKAGKNKTLSKETKERMSQSTLGIAVRSQEFRDNLSKQTQGVKKSESHKKAMRDGWARRKEMINSLQKQITANN